MTLTGGAIELILVALMFSPIAISVLLRERRERRERRDQIRDGLREMRR